MSRKLLSGDELDSLVDKHPAPPEWSEEDWGTEDEWAQLERETLTPDEFDRIAEHLRELTPTNAELLDLARRHPPAQEWFDGDMEKPW